MGKFNLNQILNDASKRAAPGGGGQTAPASRAATIERLSVFDLVPSEDNFYFDQGRAGTEAGPAARGGGPRRESATRGGRAKRAGSEAGRHGGGRTARGPSKSATDRHRAAERGTTGRSAAHGRNARRGPHRAAGTAGSRRA